MSPLLFVILLGLLAGFALFALVIGVGALTSALLNKRQNRRETNSEQQVATGEFATVLAGETTAEAESAPPPQVQAASPSTVREVEPAQVYSVIQLDKSSVVTTAKDNRAAAAVEHEPVTKAEKVDDHRSSKFPALRRRAKSEVKPNESSAPVEQPYPTEPDVVLEEDPIEPNLSEPALPELDEETVSADRGDLRESKRHAPETVEVQPQVESDEAIGEPPAQAPAAARVTNSALRRGGLFPKRTAEPTAEAEVAEVAAEPAETPAAPKPALEDPFAAVLAAVNKH